MGVTAGLLVCLTFLGGRGEPEVYVLKQRAFKVPIQVDPAQQDGLVKVLLWVSTDKGENWHQVGAVRSGETAFSYSAPADGLYWFAVQTIDRNGKAEPAQVDARSTNLRVRVKTGEPSKSAKEQMPGGNEELQKLRSKVKDLEKRIADLDQQEEIDELKTRIERLEKRLEELESRKRERFPLPPSSPAYGSAG